MLPVPTSGSNDWARAGVAMKIRTAAVVRTLFIPFSYSTLLGAHHRVPPLCRRSPVVDRSCESAATAQAPAVLMAAECEGQKEADLTLVMSANDPKRTMTAHTIAAQSACDHSQREA